VQIVKVMSMSNACSIRPGPRAKKERGGEVVAALTALRTVARRWSSDWASAEDLLQDAAVRAMSAYDRFRTGTSATAWMRTILFRLAIDETRRNRRERSAHRSYAALASEATPPAETEREAPPPPTFEVGDVHAAAGQLPESLRDTFRLWAIDGLSYQQISERLGIPLGTVGTRLLRARHAVREHLHGNPLPHRRTRRPRLRCPTPTTGCDSGQG
jgi:RNA polymerase sigma-70 factor, ECF subfamily